MEDKIEELKQLIGSLAEDSSLRRELEKVMESSTEKKPKAVANEPSEPMDDNHAESKIEEKEQPDNKTDEEKTDEENVFDSLKYNLENLLEDNEFITAAAGFVLGAVVVGLGATLVSVMRK